MKIKTVCYSASVSLGNYNNEKIGLIVQVEEDDDLEEVIECLRQRVQDVGSTNFEEMYREIRRSRTELRDLQEKIEKHRREWDSIVEFLKTQGIKPNAQTMPIFNKLLPHVEVEHYTSTDKEFFEEGELIEDTDE